MCTFQNLNQYNPWWNRWIDSNDNESSITMFIDSIGTEEILFYMKLFSSKKQGISNPKEYLHVPNWREMKWNWADFERSNEQHNAM